MGTDGTVKIIQSFVVSIKYVRININEQYNKLPNLTFPCIATVYI